MLDLDGSLFDLDRVDRDILSELYPSIVPALTHAALSGIMVTYI